MLLNWDAIANVPSKCCYVRFYIEADTVHVAICGFDTPVNAPRSFFRFAFRRVVHKISSLPDLPFRTMRTEIYSATGPWNK